MKFTYDKPDAEERECVAYIDEDGGLRLRDFDCENSAIVLVHGGTPEHGFDWCPQYATHKFYRGDSVTITF